MNYEQIAARHQYFNSLTSEEQSTIKNNGPLIHEVPKKAARAAAKKAVGGRPKKSPTTIIRLQTGRPNFFLYLYILSSDNSAPGPN